MHWANGTELPIIPSTEDVACVVPLWKQRGGHTEVHVTAVSGDSNVVALHQVESLPLPHENQ